jgi:hypothetical protein
MDAESFQLLPGVFDLFGGCHVGHGATRAEVRQNHLLLSGLQNICGFGHEMDAAKDYKFGFRARSGKLRQFERVSGKIRVADHVVALVVVT